MKRSEIVSEIFPSGIPRLWCPLLTHFSGPAVPDVERTKKHLEYISPYVGGLLIPGSTGEGWDMTDADITGLLETVLPVVKKLDRRLLIGALKPDADSTADSIVSSLERLRSFASAETPREAMRKSGVAGFTVCPPSGEHLSQKDLRTGLSRILELGQPTAIYQLPQITRNEISPELLADLAAGYPNFYLFKDTSGEDRVAKAGLDYKDVFFVRGAEGNYADWVRSGGGPYHGFLLSTANSFPAELAGVLEGLDGGDALAARDISARITRAVERMFPAAGEWEHGNAFANANKVFDHFRAWGPSGIDKPGPMLYGGSRLPKEMLRTGAEILSEEGFELGPGYMG